MNDSTPRGWRYAIYAMYIALCIGVQYFTARTEFVQLITLYGGLSVLYVLFLRKGAHTQLLREGIFLGIAARLAVVWAMPNLTDDHYRFLWDGYITQSAHNVYAYTPEQFRLFGYQGLHPEKVYLFEQLNSQPYYSIYPPFYQAIFGFTAFLSNGHFEIHTIYIKCILLLFELGTIFLLPKLLTLLHLPATHALWYILNPLVIIELTGNMHLEGPMIFFLVAASILLIQQRMLLSALVFGAAIATKLWPVMLMPLLFKQLGFMRTVKYSLVAGLSSVILLLPMLLQYEHVFGSLDLYFNQFEFNGSAYYIGKYFFDKQTQYEAFLRMRETLPLITLAGISLIAVLYRKDKWMAGMLLAFTIYLLFATTVHPWYLTPLIVLSALSGLRFPLVWSILIYLTYYTYITPAYIENVWFIWIEYVVVIGFGIYELLGYKVLDWSDIRVFQIWKKKQSA